MVVKLCCTCYAMYALTRPVLWPRRHCGVIKTTTCAFPKMFLIPVELSNCGSVACSCGQARWDGPSYVLYFGIACLNDACGDPFCRLVFNRSTRSKPRLMQSVWRSQWTSQMQSTSTIADNRAVYRQKDNTSWVLYREHTKGMSLFFNSIIVIVVLTFEVGTHLFGYVPFLET
jgi:hypothetical protein